MKLFSLRQRSLLLLSLSLLSMGGLAYAITITFRAPIATMRWTWIESRRRYNVGTYPTKPTAQIVMMEQTPPNGPHLLSTALKKAALSPFTVEGEIFPYYLTTKIPAITLMGVAKGPLTEFRANVQVTYTEHEWLFDEPRTYTVPGTIEVTIDAQKVDHAMLKYGSAVAGNHELEFGTNLLIQGLAIPHPSARPTPSPKPSPSQRTPLVEYMKNLK